MLKKIIYISFFLYFLSASTDGKQEEAYGFIQSHLFFYLHNTVLPSIMHALLQHCIPLIKSNLIAFVCLRNFEWYRFVSLSCKGADNGGITVGVMRPETSMLKIGAGQVAAVCTVPSADEVKFPIRTLLCGAHELQRRL
jgi:hypothetical protein